MIKAVIFDLDDTLYAYEVLDKEACERVREFACAEFGITAQKYEEAFLYGRSETKRSLGDVAACHNRILYFQKTLEYLGVNPVPMSLQLYETYWGTFLEKMVLREGARQLLDAMHKHGIRVMVCTDLTAHIQHRKIDALGIADDICCLVTSEEAGKEKPSGEIFALCLEKLKVLPGEICFIGDNFKKDIEGAKAAGMQAFWFDTLKPSGAQFEKAAQYILGKGKYL